MKILLLTKTTAWCLLAQMACLKHLGPDNEILVSQGYPGDPLPDAVREWKGDVILSFLCPWILPAEVLANAREAINFHPGPVWGAGYAPYSWSIYDNDEHYGVTAHYMTLPVDSGGILEFQQFPIYPGDSVYRLQQRAMRHLFALFMQFCTGNFRVTPRSLKWISPPKTRADFESLRRLDLEMSDEEIARRTRACAYPGREGAMFAGEVHP